ncbi:MAG: heavy-metal-associated domain-containing protein, partial [Gemmatimonadaceae bacterium]
MEDNVDEIRLEIDGMSCGHCVASVRTALATVPGVQVADVSIGQARV